MCSAGFPHYSTLRQVHTELGKHPGLSFYPKEPIPDALQAQATLQPSGLSPVITVMHIDITSVRTQTDGRCVLVIHRWYKEQNTTCSHVPATPTRTNAVTGHEMLAYLQLPCTCSYVPEILSSMNTSNIRGITPAQHAQTHIYTRIGVFECLRTRSGTGAWAAP